MLPFLSFLTFTPLLGALCLIGLPNPRAARWIALAVALAGLGWAGWIWHLFDPASGELQFVERHDWILSFGDRPGGIWPAAVQYFCGLDGLGLVMVLLTALLFPMAILVSWNIDQRPPLYFSLLLFLQSGLFGTFTSLNFFHWFLFWELSLVPAFFLVRLWGGARSAQAAVYFFIFTLAGSLAMLLSFVAVYLAVGSFDYLHLAELGQTGELSSALSAKLGWYALSEKQIGLVIFLGVFLGLAVKVPLVPLHSWLPLTYTQAPAPVTMLLTGLMSKMGIYGFLRWLVPLFPEQTRQVLAPLLWLSVVTILYSALAALAQRNWRGVLAYSSINHLGYCLLGIFAALTVTGPEAHWQLEKTAALNGVMLQMFNHGLVAATLFGFIAFLEGRSQGKTELQDFGGLRRVAPAFCGLMGVAVFSSLGLPGLNGFVSEFLIFKGAFALAWWAAALSVAGLLVTAVFLVGLWQGLFYGPLNPAWARTPDLEPRERLAVIPAAVLMVVLGIYPQLLIGPINSTAFQLVSRLGN